MLYNSKISKKFIVSYLPNVSLLEGKPYLVCLFVLWGTNSSPDHIFPIFNLLSIYHRLTMWYTSCRKD